MERATGSTLRTGLQEFPTRTPAPKLTMAAQHRLCQAARWQASSIWAPECKTVGHYPRLALAVCKTTGSFMWQQAAQAFSTSQMAVLFQADDLLSAPTRDPTARLRLMVLARCGPILSLTLSAMMVTPLSTSSMAVSFPTRQLHPSEMMPLQPEQ